MLKASSTKLVISPKYNDAILHIIMNMILKSKNKNCIKRCFDFMKKKNIHTNDKLPPTSNH